MPTARVLITALVMVASCLIPAPPAAAVKAGDRAPDFTLNDPDGKPVKLTDLTARGPIVLYTFVAAFTPT